MGHSTQLFWFTACSVVWMETAAVSLLVARAGEKITT